MAFYPSFFVDYIIFCHSLELTKKKSRCKIKKIVTGEIAINSLFNTLARRTIVEANINYYSVPFVHPKRKMKYHDFIYLLDGEWKIGQNGVDFPLEKDSLLILSANNTHYGVTPCTKGTKTMYFHLSCEAGDGLSSDTKSEDNSTAVCDVLIDASQNRNIKKYLE